MPGCCARCSRPVFMADEKLAVDRIWHVYCFTCCNCQIQLDQFCYETDGRELFCHRCYQKCGYPLVDSSVECCITGDEEDTSIVWATGIYPSDKIESRHVQFSPSTVSANGPVHSPCIQPQERDPCHDMPCLLCQAGGASCPAPSTRVTKCHTRPPSAKQLSCSQQPPHMCSRVIQSDCCAPRQPCGAEAGLTSPTLHPCCTEPARCNSQTYCTVPYANATITPWFNPNMLCPECCVPCSRCTCVPSSTRGKAICRRCKRLVFHAEMKIAAGSAFHDTCFSCLVCRKPLDVVSMNVKSGEIYCKQCMVRNYGPQGYGYGSGAGVLQTPD